MGVNPKYRVAVKSGGIFLRYGLEKTGKTGLCAVKSTPLWGEPKPGPLGQAFYL
jgi:hypothetical protein